MIKNKYIRQTFIVILVFLLVLGVGKLRNTYLMSDTRPTCAVFFKVARSSYVDYYYYRYRVESKVFTGSISAGELKIHSLDSLKKYNCVKIEYSKYSPSYSRVIDTRFRGGR